MRVEAIERRAAKKTADRACEVTRRRNLAPSSRGVAGTHDSVLHTRGHQMHGKADLPDKPAGVVCAPDSLLFYAMCVRIMYTYSTGLRCCGAALRVLSHVPHCLLNASTCLCPCEHDPQFPSSFFTVSSISATLSRPSLVYAVSRLLWHIFVLSLS